MAMAKICFLKGPHLLLLLLLPVKCISQGHSRTVKNFKTSMKEGSLCTSKSRLKTGCPQLRSWDISTDEDLEVVYGLC